MGWGKEGDETRQKGSAWIVRGISRNIAAFNRANTPAESIGPCVAAFPRERSSRCLFPAFSRTRRPLLDRVHARTPFRRRGFLFIGSALGRVARDKRGGRIGTGIGIEGAQRLGLSEIGKRGIRLSRSGEMNAEIFSVYRIQTQRLYNEECKFREGIAVRSII